VPLLVETGGYAFLDRVLVVDAPESEQLSRLRKRDGSSTELAERMLAAQAGRQQRLEKADDVIDNSGSLDALDAQVRELHLHYQQLAAN
jgi:dephospho-CoA kinase